MTSDPVLVSLPALVRVLALVPVIEIELEALGPELVLAVELEPLSDSVMPPLLELVALVVAPAPLETKSEQGTVTGIEITLEFSETTTVDVKAVAVAH